MAGQEKAKRKALHRGLDDIINRDASLTSRLLNRVQPVAREPLSVSEEVDDAGEPSARPTQSSVDVVNDAENERHTDRNAYSSAEEARAQVPPPSSEGLVDNRPHKSRERNLRTVEAPPNPQRAARPPGRVSGNKQRFNVTPAHAASFSWDAFVDRWGIILRSGKREGKLRICEVLYENTYALGAETFFTSYEKLAKLTSLEKKQCSINIRQLEELGVVERLNVFNTATRQGTEFRLHFTPLTLSERRSPRYYCYDEDLR